MPEPTPIARDRLARAIQVHHEHLAGALPADPEELLRQHEDLRDLLAPLLADAGVAPPVDEARLGDFRVVRELGRGAMGIVYEAEQASLGRAVALKVLPAAVLGDARAVVRFQREARLAASLDHPGITRVFGSGQQDGQYWFAMELVCGASLAEVLTGLRQRPGRRSAADLMAMVRQLSVARCGAGAAAAEPGGSLAAGSHATAAVRIAIQIADALAAAHAAGIVHRDVKPGNVMMRPDGVVKLTDFGIARSDEVVGVTRTGDFAGTPGYSSPEQLRARPGEIDHRTDLFSLGATLYELLTLQRPFDAPTVSEIRTRIERHEPTRPSRFAADVSRDLDAIVLHALEKSPLQRYATAAEFADDLRRCLEGRPVRARRVGAPTRLWRWCKRNPVAAGFLATATAGLFTVTWLALDLDRQRGLAESRLVQFRSMRVERDIKLVKQALASAPGPAPEHVAELREVVSMLDTVLAELPALRAVRDELARSGRPAQQVAPRRLLVAHPGTAQLDYLSKARAAMANWLDEMITRGEATPEWQASVGKRLAAMDARISELSAQSAARRSLVFADPADEFLFDTVEDHIAELEWLAAQRADEIRGRAALAARYATAVPDAAEVAAWQHVQQAVAADPRFAGFTLAMQPGLMPLGVDLDSGLPEFAHVASGKIPMRDSTGRLLIDGDTAVVFVLIPGGEILVGAQSRYPEQPNFDPQKQEIEQLGKVRLTPFLLAKFELGHAAWNRLAKGLDVYHECARYEGRAGYEMKPITRVTWRVCEQMCRAHGFELPTEAQWEHACRAGTTGRYWTGDEPKSLAGQEHVGGWTAPPGRLRIDELQPNPFGLHHMQGNVSEWCADPFIDKDWQTRAGDGLRSGDVDGDQRALRGASYMSLDERARTAARNTSSSADQKETIGLRPAMRLRPAT